MKEKVLLYIKAEKENCKHVEDQKLQLLNYCSTNSLEVFDIFIDINEEAEVMSKVLSKLLNISNVSGINKVVIVDYSIISRKIVKVLEFNNIIKYNNCVLDVLNGKIDINSPVGMSMKMLFNIFINHHKEMELNYD